jgi:hypothetical protein
LPNGNNKPLGLFAKAAEAVAQWLDGAGPELAVREGYPGAAKKPFAWKLSPMREGVHARLVLPLDFPATPAQIYLDKSYCLNLPHVEENGRICLGVRGKPADYDSPAHAVMDVLRAFDGYLHEIAKPGWVEEEFHRERLAYWLRYCEAVRVRRRFNTPRRFRVALPAFDRWVKGNLALYLKHGPQKRAELAFATSEEQVAHALASRYGWAKATLQKGHTLFVRMPSDMRWTPLSWPSTYFELDALIGSCTDHVVSLTTWLQEKYDGKPRPYLVVLAQDSAIYGYYLLPGPLPGVSLPTFVPIAAERVDTDWGLARDHQLDDLTKRRGKRVLVLGCGSLGAPVAELLARAGIGRMTLVDMQEFKAENASRHVLGYGSVDASKATELAQKLKREVPGLTVEGLVANAVSYVEGAVKRNQFDLVIDCTGEGSVRAVLSRLASTHLEQSAVAIAWAEPMCAAGHLVWIAPGEAWPANDPADDLNVARWADNVAVKLPACGVSFHPYGAADIWQIAAFSTERVLAHLDSEIEDSTVWTWCRGSAFFDEIRHLATPNDIVPKTAHKFDVKTFQRAYSDIFPQ